MTFSFFSIVLSAGLDQSDVLTCWKLQFTFIWISGFVLVIAITEDLFQYVLQLLETITHLERSCQLGQPNYSFVVCSWEGLMWSDGEVGRAGREDDVCYQAAAPSLVPRICVCLHTAHTHKEVA